MDDGQGYLVFGFFIQFWIPVPVGALKQVSILNRHILCQWRAGKPPGSFNCMIVHFIRLTASLGSEAKSWRASVIFVRPVNRKTEIAVFRSAAMT